MKVKKKISTFSFSFPTFTSFFLFHDAFSQAINIHTHWKAGKYVEVLIRAESAHILFIRARALFLNTAS